MTTPIRILAALFVTGIAAAAPARADTAIVVGINAYESRDIVALEGCLNDAALMQKALKNNGFDKITLLLGPDAARTKILAALDAAAKTVKPTERFVFYFAGHGSDTPRCIVPYDAEKKAKGENPTVISRETLQEKLAKVPAASRTAILDSCFSGGMKGDDGGKTPEEKEKIKKLQKRARFTDLTGSGRSVPNPNGADLLDPEETKPIEATPSGGTTTPIRYLTAAKQNQKAGEWDFPDATSGADKPGGIFTHYLVGQLDPSVSATQTAGAALPKIAQQVDYESIGGQQPLFASVPDNDPLLGSNKPTVPGGGGIALAPNAAVFGGVAGKEVRSASLWDAIFVGNADAHIVDLRIGNAKDKSKPAKTSWKVSEENFVLDVTLGYDAYVFALMRDPTGKIQIIFPDSMDLGAAGKPAYLSEASRRQGEPDAQSIGAGSLDTAGPHLIKVITIRMNAENSKALAQAWLEALSAAAKPENGGNFVSPSGAKAMTIKWKGDFRVVTSEFTIEGVK